MTNRTLKMLRISALLIIVMIEECFVNGRIVIHKREKIFSSRKVKNYCVAKEKTSHEHAIVTNSVKINCLEAPGEILKLDIGIDNYLRLNSGLFIAPDEFCALQGNPNYGKLCPSDSDRLWRKCCAENEIIDSTSFTCRHSSIKYRPKLENSSSQSFVVLNNNSSPINEGRKHFGVQLHCSNNLVPKVYTSDPCLPESSGIFKLATNGTPMYEASTGVFLRKTQLRSIEHDSYCIDGILDFSLPSCSSFGKIIHRRGNGYEVDVDDNNEVSCRSAEMGDVLLLCMEEPETILNEDDDDGRISVIWYKLKQEVPKAYFFAALWLVTCPLLLSSAIVNSFLIQRNVHGWILTSYLISMCLVNINSVILILDINLPESPRTVGGCRVLDFTMKFIYLSSLCWMSSMCMNMLRTFSSSFPQVAIAPHRFFLSALFSLGLPIIVVTGSYYVGSLPDYEPLFQAHPNVEDDNLKDQDTTTVPELKTCQKSTCALYSYKTLPYYSGSIIVLVFGNVLAFIKTSTTIASLRRQTEAVLHKQARDHLESFALFAKLFLLTGSIWVIRVALLVLQIQSLYVTWYGVALEAVFSIPEVVFPMIIFHHPEFIKWVSRKSPVISGAIVKCSPFCKKNLVFIDRVVNTPELQSANQMSSIANDDPYLKYRSSRPKPSQNHGAITSDTATTSITGATSTKPLASMLMSEATTV